MKQVAFPQRQNARARERARLEQSWMMRCLNECIARRANKEDGCKGRFWEGRFKSQALLDEEGLLTCMAYVDLNPVRAGLASSLKGSDFTSIQERLRLADEADRHAEVASATPAGLAPFADDKTRKRADRLPMDFLSYVELVQWTGRALRSHGPRGRIRGPKPALLARFGFDSEAWLAAMRAARDGGDAERLATQSALGHPEALRSEAERRDCRWLRGTGFARRLCA